MNEQSTQFEKLYSRVMREVATQRLKAQGLPATPHHARLFGQFIRARLELRGQTPAELARALMMKPEVVEHLLNGGIPEWVFSDEALARIGRALDVETNQLRILLKRALPPAQSEVIADR